MDSIAHPTNSSYHHKIQQAKDSQKNNTGKWGRKVGQVFSSQQQQEALDILGLFVLNRFRQLEYEEVIAMLNFDLMDTVAGRQVYEMGSIQNAREMVLELLDERFGRVSNKLTQQIRSISQQGLLGQLLRQVIRCDDIGGFEETLSKVLPPKKPQTH